MMAAFGASPAMGSRASERSRLSLLGEPQTPRGPRSIPARTSAAEGGRLDCGSTAERRRRCRDRGQELTTEPLPCLINSAGSSTYPSRKSVRTTRATPFPGRWPREGSAEKRKIIGGHTIGSLPRFAAAGPGDAGDGCRPRAWFFVSAPPRWVPATVAGLSRGASRASPGNVSTAPTLSRAGTAWNAGRRGIRGVPPCRIQACRGKSRPSGGRRFRACAVL